LDFGVSHHISPNSTSFAFVFSSSYIPVMTDNNTHMLLIGVGFVVTLTPHSSLPNVYFILKFILNLAFVGQLCNFDNYLVIFSSLFCRV
jgi:hypothetical protein